MRLLVFFLATVAMAASLGGLYLVRRRRGTDQRVTGDDYATGCLLISVAAGGVAFAVALWWFDRSFWAALAAGAVFTLVVGGQLLIHSPPPDDER